MSSDFDPVAHAMAQGDRIAGYRKMTEAELTLFNEGKQLAASVGAFVNKLQQQTHSAARFGAYGAGIPGVRPCDQRWVSIGQTHLQQGFMALLRGIAQPDGF